MEGGGGAICTRTDRGRVGTAANHGTGGDGMAVVVERAVAGEEAEPREEASLGEWADPGEWAEPDEWIDPGESANLLGADGLGEAAWRCLTGRKLS